MDLFLRTLTFFWMELLRFLAVVCTIVLFFGLLLRPKLKVLSPIPEMAETLPKLAFFVFFRHLDVLSILNDFDQIFVF